jgi:hypothetical protein
MIAVSPLPRGQSETSGVLMIPRLSFVAVGLCIFLSCGVLCAAQNPLTIYPNPLAFGTIAENTTSYPLPVYITNTSSSPVAVISITITGTNSSSFAFYGSNCVGTIDAQQTCIMTLTFSPNAIQTFAANLVFTYTGSGGPITIPISGSGGDPVPTITSLLPDTAYVGSNGANVTVTGTGFVTTSLVYLDYNSAPLATTYVSPTQLSAQIPASDLTYIQGHNVYVSNPSPGGNSQSYTFSVVGLDPSISTVSPTSVVAGSPTTTLAVTGGNFMEGATLLWNGKRLTTTFVNSGELQAQLTTNNLVKPQIVQLSISNPSPGGRSPAVNFNVTYPAVVRALDLPANDVVWDPYAQRIYASLPSSYGTHGNSIAVINPTNGSITGYHYVGSEPNQLALSADAKYLYVGLNGSGSVQRVILPGFTPDINIGLGTGPYGPNTALSMQVSPADSHTFAISVGVASCCGSAQLEFFKDSTMLPNYISYPDIASIQFVSSSLLYGYYNGTLAQVAVNSNGGTLTTQWNALTGSGNIEYAAGLIYDDSGQVFNPASGELMGSYDVNGSYGTTNPLFPEPAINSTFVVGTSPFISPFGITSYNLSQFIPQATISLPQFNGTPLTVLIPWGSNGFAFTLSTGCCGNTNYQLILVSSAMMLPKASTNNPVPTATSLTPSSTAHGGGNFPLTVKGSGFVPGSQVTWNGVGLTVSYISSTQLTAYVPYTDIASAGSASVIVTNPAPGGGASGTLTFTIN